jgi:predicted ATP-grasp superfamily ATP-dependent carboligase
MTRIDPPHVLVHEYVSGGGWAEPELPASLAAEGRAMLRAVLADLSAWGRVRTCATVDVRMPGLDLAADRLVPLAPARHMSTLEELALECDAAIVIAPESEGVLTRITKRLESLNVPLLGATSGAVSAAGDKWQCYQLFCENTIPTPKTRLVADKDALDKATGLKPPWVIKPRAGAGADGVYLAMDPVSLHRAQILAGFGSDQCLLQSFIPGVHASVSLLSNGEDAIALSLNQQNMQITSSLVYTGGKIPLRHPLEQRALSLARYSASLIPGLRGYIGVDLVLTANECYVIEINPRITTSYVGLRRVIDLNLAEAIWDSCWSGRLPQTVEINGTVSFAKDGLYG